MINKYRVTLPCVIALFFGAAVQGAAIGDTGQRTNLLVNWGSYRVVCDDLSPKLGGDKGFGICIVSRQSKTLRSILVDFPSDAHVSLVNDKSGRRTLLVIWVHPGSTDQGYTNSFVFSSDRGIRNVAVIRGDSVAGALTASGKMTVLLSAYSTIFEWSADFCNACSPYNIPIVYAWNGKYYAEATKSFPQWSISSASTFRTHFPSDLAKANKATGDYVQWDGDALKADIAGYYGNMAMIGKPGAALRWINTSVPLAFRQWFYGFKSEFDVRLKEAKYTSYQSDQSTYNGDMLNPWG
jgi:hypothetical protein